MIKCKVRSLLEYRNKSIYISIDKPVSSNSSLDIVQIYLINFRFVFGFHFIPPNIMCFMLQICFLTLQSSVKNNMRIIVITETFNLSNMTPDPINLSLNVIPLTKNKVRQKS